ncbi:MAG: hypothetical protein RL291_948 [Pseudomonadota bacterium]
MTRARCCRVALVGALAALASTAVLPSTAAACVLTPGPRHTVAAIIDADTVRLETSQDLRLIGILGPRPSDVSAEGRWPAADEAIEALRALLIGQPVLLKFDRLQRDRNGKVLAHLFLGTGKPDDWVQAKLLAAGHARAMTTADNPHCAKELAAAETTARSNRAGLWQNPAYDVRQASHTGRLALLHGTYQIVRGQVGETRTRQGVTDVELVNSAGRRTLFRFRQDNREILGALGGDPRRLKGETIEVRGWVLREGGPSGLRRDIVIDATASGFASRLPAPAKSKSVAEAVPKGPARNDPEKAPKTADGRVNEKD